MTTPIKFGYMLDFRNPESSNLDFGTFYAEMFRQIDFIERAGFHSIWLTEHHFVDDGYLAPVMPMLAAIAARTTRLTLGTYVLLAPFYHPLRLAEDAAMIDVLSGGRLRLGIGMGYRDEEFDALQVSKKTRLSRTLETIEILKRAWTRRALQLRGQAFQFSRCARDPAPDQQAVSGAAMGRDDDQGDPARRRAGFGIRMQPRTPSDRDLSRGDARARQGSRPNYSLVNSRIVYVADDEKKAWDDIEAAAMYQAGLYGKWLSAATPGQNWIQPDANQLKSSSIIGSPETVRARLAEVIETAGRDRVDHQHATPRPRALEGDAVIGALHDRGAAEVARLSSIRKRQCVYACILAVGL